MSLERLSLPPENNYIACFLTLNCNLRCEYCINNFNSVNEFNFPIISGKDWVKGLNRISTRSDVPITLQGGEPSMHPDFIWIINNLKNDLNIDILTNLCFDVDEFMLNVDPKRLKRNALYANIRVSYHPVEMDLDRIIKDVLKLKNKGYSVGIYGILYPRYEKDILNAQEICQKEGIDFRTKEFLGEFKGKLYGTFGYKEAVYGNKKRKCFCRSSDLIIAPNGNIYRCHHDLYKHFSHIGNILDSELKVDYKFIECCEYGDCNPCDVKVKTDRFQVFGHTSVEIKDIE